MRSRATRYHAVRIALRPFGTKGSQVQVLSPRLWNPSELHAKAEGPGASAFAVGECPRHRRATADRDLEVAGRDLPPLGREPRGQPDSRLVALRSTSWSSRTLPPPAGNDRLAGRPWARFGTDGGHGAAPRDAQASNPRGAVRRDGERVKRRVGIEHLGREGPRHRPEPIRRRPIALHTLAGARAAFAPHATSRGRRPDASACSQAPLRSGKFRRWKLNRHVRAQRTWRESSLVAHLST
jgi:hypothetical protein